MDTYLIFNVIFSTHVHPQHVMFFVFSHAYIIIDCPFVASILLLISIPEE